MNLHSVGGEGIETHVFARLLISGAGVVGFGGLKFSLKWSVLRAGRSDCVRACDAAAKAMSPRGVMGRLFHIRT